MTRPDPDPESPATDNSDLSHAAPLIDRCTALLDEIQTLQDAANDGIHSIELRTFKGNVQSELRFLKNIGTAAAQSTVTDAPDDDRTQHFLRSSNLRYFELVWAAAKASPGLVSLLTHIPETGLCPFVKQDKHGKPVKTVQVEVVAEDGLQWIKLSAISPKRLMYELAKAGWEGFHNDDDDDDGHNESESQNTSRPMQDSGAADWNQTVISAIPLVQHAEILARAAQRTWVRYKHPRITYLFHNVERKICGGPIEMIFKRIEGTGAEVRCADDEEGLVAGVVGEEGQSVGELLERIRDREKVVLTKRVNIDCTILLALASEISCQSVDPTSRPFNRAILSQLRTESTHPLLTRTLFPALTNHILYCTPQARLRFVEIILEIGTPAEKLRAEAILGYHFTTPDPSTDTPIPKEKLHSMFQEQCKYPVPEGLMLPIRVYDQALEDQCVEEGPKEWRPWVGEVASKLSKINRSVFFVGWEVGDTTVTSNMVTARAIESIWTGVLDGLAAEGKLAPLLEEEDAADECGLWEAGSVENGRRRRRVGPDLWVVEMARSLVGKGPKVDPPDPGPGSNKVEGEVSGWARMREEKRQQKKLEFS